MRRFTNANSDSNVVFNFRHNAVGDLVAFAVGYRRAAGSLITRFAKHRYSPDYDGYPILYLYRHALELYLKAVVHRGTRLMRINAERPPDADKLFERHDLGRLLTAILSSQTIEESPGQKIGGGAVD